MDANRRNLGCPKKLCDMIGQLHSHNSFEKVENEYVFNNLNYNIKIKNFSIHFANLYFSLNKQTTFIFLTTVSHITFHFQNFTKTMKEDLMKMETQRLILAKETQGFVHWKQPILC